MDDRELGELLHWLNEQYELEPDVAEELLQRILKILSEYDPADEFS